MVWIIVFGNPMEGFNYIGPFNILSEAERYATGSNLTSDYSWWIAPVERPRESDLKKFCEYFPSLAIEENYHATECIESNRDRGSSPYICLAKASASESMK